MNEKEVIEILSEIPIGAVVAWIVAATGILGAVAAFTIRMYKVFDKYKKTRDEDEALRLAVSKNSEEITKTNEKMDAQNDLIIRQLQEIKESLDIQRESKIKELRHTIVTVGEDALAKKQISIRAWQSLLEMYSDYKNIYHQNSFVQSLMERVEKTVEVVGQLDEHGYDIE